MKSFNERAVNGLYHSSKAARIILNELAGMPKQNETLLESLEDRLKDQEEVNRREVVNFFKQLEEFGAGEFIPGRRGHPSRFHWGVDSINLSTVEANVPTAAEEPAVRPLPPHRHEVYSHHQPHLEAMPAMTLSHTFQLRPGYSVQIALPADLTTGEAHRLSQFILSLPFAPETVVSSARSLAGSVGAH